MDFTPVLIWWLIILIFGLVGWPVAFNLLRHLPDRGFAFARPVGLLLTGYLLWIGGTFRLLQHSAGGILVALILVLAIGLIWQRRFPARDGLSMPAWLRREWRYALTVELLFGLAFVGWAIFKAYNPNIETAGGEKWMEIAFINGTLRSDYFPPQDPWLSGFAISYYYFGYVFMAMVTRLTGLVSTTAFNLYIPTLLAMTLTAALGVVANLVSLHQSSTRTPDDGLQLPASALPLSAVFTGFIAALFVAVLGNLEGLLEVLHKRGLLPANFWLWLDIRDLKVPPVPSNSWVPDRFIWWWRGSRVLTDYTLTGHEQEVIDEFPFFSFLLGDVHPHVLALPFVLVVVALALNLLANRRALLAGQASPAANSNHAGMSISNVVDKSRGFLQNSWDDLSQATGGRLAFGLYAIFLGGLSFLNTWDFPIYLSVVGVAYVVWLFYQKKDWQFAMERGVAGTAILGLTGIILYLPFYATFQSQAKGILPNLWNPTRLPQFFVFFGPFLVAAIVLVMVLSRKYEGWSQRLGWSIPLTVLGPLLIMLVALSTVLISPSGRDYVQGILNNPEVQPILGETTVGALVQESLRRRLLNPWTFLLLGTLLGWVLALLAGKEGVRQPLNEAVLPLVEAEPLKVATTPAGASAGPVDPPGGWQFARPPGTVPAGVPLTGDRAIPASLLEKFVLILLLVGLGLPLAVEFVYLRDNFGIRMNTIFKFYFQAWVLLALASAFAVYFVSKNLRGIPALAWQASMALLVAAGMVYPLLAIPNKANYFQDEPTLNGIQWVAQHRPGDYAAIQWLRANAPDGAVVLEAPGKSYAAYQYTGRISALTGVPTLLGWGGHESQWRGNYDEPARREPDIDTLFNTVDLSQAQMLLDKYNVTYVVIGPLERERYSPPGLNKFPRLMEVAFQQDDVTIFRRR